VASNRRIYEAAIKRAANLAWEKKWSRAIEEYRKALSEFPEDATALTGLGLAYAETQQLEQALATYKKAANLSPDNPEVIQRVAQIYERLAQWPESARVYVLAADAYLHLRDVSHAIQMWRKAAMLDPENMDAHRNLARVYRNQNEARRAARHVLIMARVLARRHEINQALERCKLALELDPHNPEAEGILEALKNGQPLPDGPTARLQPDAEGKRTLDSFVVFEDIELGTGPLVSEEEIASPADMLRERSLAQIADALFSEVTDPKMAQANLLLGQAADFQTRGLADRAIDAYTSALRMGVNSAALYFNLGQLYQQQGDPGHAIEYFSQALSEPDYKLGAHFAIGDAYYGWGRPSEALEHLLKVLLAVDAPRVDPEQLSALEAAYEQLYQQYAGQGHTSDTGRFIESIISLLSLRGWGQRLIQAREQLNNLAGGELLVTLAEMLTEPSAETAMVAMSEIERYLKQGLVFTALEECFWSIQRAPYYLPLHLRLADILISEGRLDEAVAKYVTVAETYRVRGNLERAIAIYRKALETEPMNIRVREQLIQTLIDARMFDQAVEQYIAIADAYYQLAQVEHAVVKLNDALAYAPRGSPDRHWEANILHRIGDIHVQRLDWRQAIRTYQRIKHMHPDDDKARTHLVDLHLKLGEPETAMGELDQLIEYYRNKREPRKTITVLRDLVASRKGELALHIRLARAYLEMKMKKEAIAELDTVGELQLEAGMTREAIRTIQAIIRLGPDNVQGYHQLLSQLKAP
jgi:tetratricopeptide (TPR) repeat protein